MKSKDILIALLLMPLCLLTQYCRDKQDVHDKPVSIDIKPDDILHGGPSLKASSILQSIRYIPLETTSLSTFSKIDKMLVTEKFFFIMDKAINKILIFSRSGKFFSEIGNLKELRDFSIDNAREEIYVSSEHGAKLKVFNYQGEGTREIIHNLWFDHFHYAGENSFLFYCGYYPQDQSNGSKEQTKEYNIYTYKENASSVDGIFPFDAKSINGSDVIHSHQNFFNNGNTVYFIPEYHNTAYKLSRNNVPVPAFEFKYPDKNKLPEDFLTSLRYFRQRITYLKNTRNIYFNITDLYKVKDYLIFTISNSNKQRFSVLYNLKDNKPYLVNRILNDVDFISLNPPFLAATSNRLYAVSSAQYMGYEYSKLKKKMNPMPPGLKNISDISYNHNPVLKELIFK